MRVRCIVVKLCFVAKKPSYKDYPKELNTLGDHLRKVRLDRNMSQSDVAEVIGADTDTITCWELNRNTPTAKCSKKIIEFVGYIPSEWSNGQIGQQLHYTRLICGMTQKDIALKLGLDCSTIHLVENGSRQPMLKTRQKIEKLVSQHFAN